MTLSTQLFLLALTPTLGSLGIYLLLIVLDRADKARAARAAADDSCEHFERPPQ